MPKIVNHDHRRREIIEACWQLLAEHGSDSLTIRKIANAANCAIGGITHYFVNREALIAAALRASYDDFKSLTDTILAMDIQPTEKLRFVAEAMFSETEANLSDASIWLSFWNQATMHKSLAAESATWFESWHKDLMPLMTEVNDELDSAHEADVYIALANGLNIQLAIAPTKATQKRALDTMNLHIKKLSKP